MGMVLSAGALWVWMILANLLPIQDPDFWWHLASGRYMVLHHLIPRMDPFSLTAHGSAWVDTYWLQEIMAYLFYSLAGLNGLIILNAALIASLIFLIAWNNPDRSLSWPLRLWGMLWIFFAAHPRGYGWGEKASLATFGFLGLLFYTLRSERGRAPSRLTRAWPFLFILWANVHRGFILGLLILGVYIAERCITRRQERFSLIVWGLACVGATLLNPWGYGIYGMGWQDFHFSPAHVTGWAQTPFGHLELFWITLLIFWSFVYWEIRRGEQLGIGFLLTSLILSVVSMRYASLYPYFIIWSVPWLLAFGDKEWPTLRSSIVSIVPVLGTCIALLAIKPAFGINAHIFPVQAVEFLKSNNLRLPFFHEYELGGYYLWALDGNPPVLIDGRYPAVQGYQRLFPEMQRVIQGTPADFQGFLAANHLHSAVVKYPSTQFLPVPFDVYFPRDHWALVYWDDLVMIFIERTPEMRDAIKPLEFVLAQPDAHPGYWKKVLWPRLSARQKDRLREELRRNVQLHPESAKARFWLNLAN